jgi:creatinine amidohydrolase
MTTGTGQDQDQGVSPEDQAPAISAGPILLADLTSTETAELKDKIELILIPVGAHEQHGPALPVSTDTLSVQVLCSLVGTLLRPRVAVAPAIPWGNSWSHLDRAGTISLRPETLTGIVVDIVDSLSRNGFKRFMLVNGHGGNNATLRIAAEACRNLSGSPLVVPVYSYSLIAAAGSEFLGDAAPGHGGGDEASIVLSARPELVRREHLQNPEVNGQLDMMARILMAAGGTLPIPQSSYSNTGTTGDASDASEEAGKLILGQVTNQLRAIVEQLLDTEIPD